MNARPTAASTVHIVISVNDPLSSAIETEHVGDIEGTIAGAVLGMLSDLDIEAETSVAMRPREEEPLFASQAFDVHVDGVRCRLPVPSDTAAVVHAQTLARDIIEAIYWNRELLVSPDIVDAFRTRWLDDAEALRDVSDPTLTFHLRALVRHGASVLRGRDMYASFIRRSDPEASPEYLFEVSLGGVETVGVTIGLGQLQHTQLAGHDDATSTDADGLSEPGTGSGSLSEMLEELRQGLFFELGLMLPDVQIHLRTDIDAGEIQFQINDLRSPPVPGLAEGELFVNETPDRLALLGLRGRPAFSPANGSEGAILRDADAHERAMVSRAGLTTWSPAEYLVLLFSAAIRREAGRLLNRDHVRYGLDRLRHAFPSLVEAAERRIPGYILTNELRNILNDGLGIRDLRGILESLLAARVNCEDDSPVTSEQTAAIRRGMRAYISDKYAGDAGTLTVILLDRETAAQVLKDCKWDDPERIHLIRILGTEIRKYSPTSQSAQLVVPLRIRELVSRLIAMEFPWIRVLSYQDLGLGLNIQPIERVAWSGRQGEMDHVQGGPAGYLALKIEDFYDEHVGMLNLGSIPEDGLEPLYATGYYRFSAGNYGGAREIFESLVASSPEEPLYWRALGAVNQQMRNYRQAVDSYDKAIALDIDDSVSQVYRGESLMLSGDVTMGIEALISFLQMDGTVPDHRVWQDRARLLVESHDR